MDIFLKINKRHYVNREEEERLRAEREVEQVSTARRRRAFVPPARDCLLDPGAEPEEAAPVPVPVKPVSFQHTKPPTLRKHDTINK